MGLTPAGGTRCQDIRIGVDRISERLYASLTTEGLATAARVLTSVTDKAKARAGPGSAPTTPLTFVKAGGTQRVLHVVISSARATVFLPLVRLSRRAIAPPIAPPPP